jgi:predicted NBD/HSP70 family sugar kinase/predicted transcriptional regulator
LIDINKADLSTSTKEQNIMGVLDELINKDNISPLEIARHTNLSPATVSRILGQLQEKNLIKNMGKEETSKGRKPSLFSFNSNYGLLLHYFITYQKVTGYLINLGGEVLDRCEMFYDLNSTLEDLLSIISNIYNELKKNKLLKVSRVLAAGFAIPGVIDKKTRKVFKIPDVLSLDETNLFDYAEKLLGVPVIVNNDARMAALGEKDVNYNFVENLVYLDITNHIGIGMGIIIGNNLVKGCNNLAGEIGQSYFDPYCSMADYLHGKGQLESEAGLSTMFARVENKLKNGGAKILARMLEGKQSLHFSVELIEEAVRQGDADVFEEFERTLKAWSIMIININLYLNPDFIILGGSISNKNSLIYEFLNGMFSHLGIFTPQLRLSVLGDDAQLFGGIHVLKQYVCNSTILAEAKNMN